MGITVNVAEFQAVQRKIRDAADGKFLPELAARMGAAMTKLLADEFNQSRDPYGNAWKPVFRRRKRDRAARLRRLRRLSAAGLPLEAKADKPLVDSGRLRAASVASSAVQSSPTSVRVIIPVDYASYHQHGTRAIARRQILPEADTGGLGWKWTAALNAEAIAVLNRRLGPGPGRGGVAGAP